MGFSTLCTVCICGILYSAGRVINTADSIIYKYKKQLNKVNRDGSAKRYTNKGGRDDNIRFISTSYFQVTGFL